MFGLQTFIDIDIWCCWQQLGGVSITVVLPSALHTFWCMWPRSIPTTWCCNHHPHCELWQNNFKFGLVGPQHSSPLFILNEIRSRKSARWKLLINGFPLCIKQFQFLTVDAVIYFHKISTHCCNVTLRNIIIILLHHLPIAFLRLVNPSPF